MSRFQLDIKNKVSIEFRTADADVLVVDDPESIKNNFYDDFYAENSENDLHKTREKQFESILDIIRDKCPENSRILEVGAGNGYFIKFLRKNLVSAEAIVAIDPFSSSSEVEKIGVETYSPEEKFDLIILLDVFEHFADPDALLSNLAGLLNDQGHLLLKVPNKKSLIYSVSKSLRYILPALSRKIFKRLYQLDYYPPHFFYYDDESLNKMVSQKHSFNEVYTRYIPEVYFSTIISRLWGLNWWSKALLLPIVSVLIFLCLCRRKWNDGVVLLFQKIS